MPSAELKELFITQTGTEKVINMPYACSNSQNCAPYKISLLPGSYEIELWGASGGSSLAQSSGSIVPGGLAGYVKGTLKIEEQKTLYFYVGSKGYPDATSSYNGGGLGPSNSPNQGQGAGGGGSTDVRLLPLFFDEIASLKSRFMVAGAGGGSCSYSHGKRGGNNLGINGEAGQLYIIQGCIPGTPPSGGSQTSPGNGYKTPTDYGRNGTFGSAGKGGDVLIGTGAGAGGSGFYGGGSGGWSHGIVASGAAGSSFVSGHEDCVVINDIPILTNTTILGGTDTIMSPLGVEETGHAGNGFARITVITGAFIYKQTHHVKKNSLDKTVVLLIFFLLLC